MFIPQGLTESAVLAVIQEVVDKLAPRFVFGYYEVEDLKQEGFLHAMEALPRFDPSRELQPFLARHVRFRYLNLVRNKLRRSDAPCKECHSGHPCAGTAAEPAFCERYALWVEINTAKSRIMCAGGLTEAVEATCADEDLPAIEQVARAELSALIDASLPIELRSTYLRMRDGARVPKARRQEVLDALRDILLDDDGDI